ncbi:MAG: hypothetical protein C0469_15170 [Cyanobacteria bacterium DS2.3.42]|nr:hypothetical protein [Cyanobacteria bacterium DS2.3.42]
MGCHDQVKRILNALPFVGFTTQPVRESEPVFVMPPPGDTTTLELALSAFPSIGSSGVLPMHSKLVTDGRARPVREIRGRKPVAGVRGWV